MSEELEAQKAANIERDDKLAEMKKAIAELTIKVERKASSGASEETTSDNVIKELNLRKSKELNLIINGQPEMDSTASKEDCDQHDIKFMKNLLSYLKQEPYETSVASIKRLGPRKDEGQHVRPLQVVFKNKPSRNKVLDAAPALAKQNNWSKVKIGPDMTIAQRRTEQKLRQDAKSKNLARTKDQLDKNKGWKVVGRRGQRRLLLVDLEDTETIDEEGQVIPTGTRQKRKREQGGTPTARREARLSVVEIEEEEQTGEE